MNAIDNVKNSLIDRILATKNEKLLEAINSIFDSTQSEEIISLSSEQIEMLSMSEKDIQAGKFISESELSKRDSEWLRYFGLKLQFVKEIIFLNIGLKEIKAILTQKN